MTTDDLLKQGIAALNAGRKAEARNLLMQVVQQDERNEMAWLWLSGAVDTDEDRRVCLENVLAINPNNGVAKRGLESLIAKEGVRPLSVVSSPTPRAEPGVTPREQPTQPPAQTSPPNVTRGKKRKAPPKRKKATRQQTRLMIGFGAAVLVLTCIALAAVWWAVDSGLVQLGSAAPGLADITQVSSASDATSTPVPNPTQIPTRTPTLRPTHTPWPRPTPAPRFGSLESPVPFGETLPLRQNEVTDFEIAIADAYRGDEAWQILHAENMYNDPPSAGMEYVRVYIEVKCLKGPSSDPLRITRWDFNLLSKGRVFEPAILVEPEPTFDEVVLLPGGSAGGWISFLVHADDSNPLLVAAMDSSEEGGFYFAVESSPRPTTTLTSTPMPIPTVAIQTQRLGPMRDSHRDESYTAQISLNGVRFDSGNGWSKPKQGYVYVIVDISVKNLGPDPMRSISPYDFQVRDVNGALRDSGWVPDTEDCKMDTVDLAPNGGVSGCIGFEVPVDGTLELIYAPYKYEGLQPGRYLSFTIRR